jgi:hypothetical protein
VLYSLGWDSPSNLNTSISVPRDLSKSTFFKVIQYKFNLTRVTESVGFFKQVPQYRFLGAFPTTDLIEYPEPKNDLQKEILSAVTSLSNFISMESASRSLKRLVVRKLTSFICNNESITNFI